ncbi:MAG: ribbon-helix-helix domain-containing protein [Pseudomonadota bacterium]
MEKRSLSLRGHRTSVALEPTFWAALESLANASETPIASYIATLDDTRVAKGPFVGLASYLRQHILQAAIDGRLGDMATPTHADDL